MRLPALQEKISVDEGHELFRTVDVIRYGR